MKRIIIAAEIFPPDIGGPATYSERIATELQKRGFEVWVICYSNKIDQNRTQLDKKYRFNLIRIRRSWCKPLHYYRYYRTLKKMAADADSIYAQGPVGSGLLAWLIAEKMHKKLVVKVVGDYAWERAYNTGKTKLLIDEFQKRNFKGLIGLLQGIERRVCLGAVKVIVPSQYLKKIVLGWGIDEQKIEVIYNSVDFKAIDPIPRPNNELWMVTVARLVPWKGIDTLIELMPNLLNKFPTLKFKIIGDGPDRMRLSALIKSVGLEKNVEILGAKSHDETLAYIHAANIVILNSGYEGLSHVLVEAVLVEALSFGWGRAVLASNIGGNPELIIPGKTGQLFGYNNKNEIESAITENLPLPNTPADFFTSAEASQFLKRFEFKTMVDHTIETLEHI